jgi:dipeptide/tripeptide permease
MALSFFLLLFDAWVGILIISIVIITFGEIFTFPFANGFAMSRAPKGQVGRYMALYTMSFSLAHIISSKLGLEIISHFGYTINWIVMGSFGITAMLFSLKLHQITKK